MKAYFKTRRFAPCVVSGKEYATFFYLACRKMGMPLVMWEHTNFTVGVPLKSEWTGMHIALRNFAAVVCLTKKDEKAYLAHKKSAAVRQIYNITTYQESPAPYRIHSKKNHQCGLSESDQGL